MLWSLQSWSITPTLSVSSVCPIRRWLWVHEGSWRGFDCRFIDDVTDRSGSLQRAQSSSRQIFRKMLDVDGMVGFAALLSQVVYLLSRFRSFLTACWRWHAAKAKEQFKRLMLTNISQPEENIPSWHMSGCLLALVYINTKCCRGWRRVGLYRPSEEGAETVVRICYHYETEMEN